MQKIALCILVALAAQVPAARIQSRKQLQKEAAAQSTEAVEEGKWQKKCYGPGSKACGTYDFIIGLITCCPSWAGVPLKCSPPPGNGPWPMPGGGTQASPPQWLWTCKEVPAPAPAPPPTPEKCFELGHTGCVEMQSQCCPGLACISYQGSMGCWPANGASNVNATSMIEQDAAALVEEGTSSAKVDVERKIEQFKEEETLAEDLISKHQNFPLLDKISKDHMAFGWKDGMNGQAEFESKYGKCHCTVHYKSRGDNDIHCKGNRSTDRIGMFNGVLKREGGAKTVKCFEDFCRETHAAIQHIFGSGCPAV